MIITALWLLMFGVHSQSPEVGQRHRYHAMSTPKTIGFMSTRSATQIGTGRDPPTGSMPPTDSSPRDVAWLDSSVFKHDESQRIPGVGGEQHPAADRLCGVGEAALRTGHHDGRVAEPLLVQAGQPVATIEAMKMEASITSPVAGTVQRVALQQSQTVEGGDLLLVVTPS